MAPQNEQFSILYQGLLRGVLHIRGNKPWRLFKHFVVAGLDTILVRDHPYKLQFSVLVRMMPA